MVPVLRPSLSCAWTKTSFRAAPPDGSPSSAGRSTGRSPGRWRLGVVEEIHSEIEERARHRLAADGDMLLHQVPAARPDDQHGRVGAELVGLARGGVGEVQLAGPAVLQVELALDTVRPGRRVRILEVGHEDLRAAVQRVDDHLAVGRSGDLDATVEQVGRDRADAPVALAHMLRLGEEVRGLAGVEALLALGAQREQALARGVEALVQVGDEGERLRRQDLVEARVHRAGDGGGRRIGHAVLLKDRMLLAEDCALPKLATTARIVAVPETMSRIRLRRRSPNVLSAAPGRAASPPALPPPRAAAPPRGPPCRDRRRAAPRRP